MKSIAKYIEGFILLSLGFYIGALIIAGDYWRYMNPKFEWLTGAAAIMLIITGGIALLKPYRRPNISGIVVFLAFFGVAATDIDSPPGSQGVESSTQTDSSIKDGSHSILKGLQYTKINLAEVYQHCLDGKPEKIAGRYVTRGIVRRTPELDRAGQFALLRTAVVCCLAHAAPVGFRVDYKRCDELQDGQWVKVYGALKEQPPNLPNHNLHTKGLFFTRLNRSHGIVPTRIVKIPQPEDPYIFEFRSAEPYAY